MRNRLWVVVVSVAGLLAVAPLAAADRAATKQRVTITAHNGIDSFVLTPTGSGPIARDSGAGSWCCWKQVFTSRRGQKVETNVPTLTLTGDRGVLVLKVRIEWVDAGNGYSVGTGAWTVVRGTGSYSNVRGGGEGAHLWIGQSPRSWRLEGYLTPR